MTTNAHPSTERLQQLNRMYHTISRCNQHMIRAESEQTLAQKFCSVMVEEGGYRMAWVGYAENDEARSIRPVAHAGLESGYLENLNLTWADTDRGSGPGARCIREQTVQVTRDIADDPRFVFWREEATKRGYASSIALPLTIRAGTLGFLGMYSERGDAFDEEEIGLLTEAAEDLAYGITALRNRRERDALKQALSDQLLQVQETERANLARELHDEFGQTLTAAKLQLQMLGQRMSSPFLEDCIALVDQGLQQVRALSLDLRPPQLDRLGLAAALRAHVGRLSQQTELPVTFEEAPGLPGLAGARAAACFRIVQEALTNAIRHARAQSVRVRLAVDQGMLSLEVADDGAGFDLEAKRSRAAHGGSLGLLSMEERAHLLGGTLHIHTGAGRGTRISARVPLWSAEGAAA